MMNGNPAGPTNWFFAFEQNSHGIAGMISVMPRALVIGGHKIRAGIAGDLVVDEKHRSSGCALCLIKKVINSIELLNISFIYVIPNANSKKAFEQAGFTTIGHYIKFVRPINTSYYLEKYAKNDELTACLPEDPECDALFRWAQHRPGIR